jgi:hypothetical protein
MQYHERKAGQPEVRQRFLKAGAKATHTRQDRIDATAFNGFGERVIQAFGTVASAASAHSDRDSRYRRD